jgi:hypothetical protein
LPNITVSNSLLEPGREGVDAATLTCLADANPPATYRWLRKAVAGTLTEEPTYTLDPVDRTHIDTYSCIASNYLGSSQPGPVDLNVLYAPNMTVTASSTAPLVEGRDSVVLDCQVRWLALFRGTLRAHRKKGKMSSSWNVTKSRDLLCLFFGTHTNTVF